MRFPTLLSALALAACLALAIPLALPSAPVEEPSFTALQLQGAPHGSCKPSGPVHLEITDRDLRGDRLTLRYAVHAEREVQGVTVVAEADRGATLSKHQAARAAQLATGAKRNGTLDLRLTGDGARALLHATVTFVGGDDQGNEWLETVTVTHVEVMGDAPLEADGLTPVDTEGEISLSMPTRHL